MKITFQAANFMQNIFFIQFILPFINFSFLILKFRGGLIHNNRIRHDAKNFAIKFCQTSVFINFKSSHMQSNDRRRVTCKKY